MAGTGQIIRHQIKQHRHMLIIRRLNVFSRHNIDFFHVIQLLSPILTLLTCIVLAFHISRGHISFFTLETVTLATIQNICFYVNENPLIMSSLTVYCVFADK